MMLKELSCCKNSLLSLTSVQNQSNVKRPEKFIPTHPTLTLSPSRKIEKKKKKKMMRKGADRKQAKVFCHVPVAHSVAWSVGPSQFHVCSAIFTQHTAHSPSLSSLLSIHVPAFITRGYSTLPL